MRSRWSTSPAARAEGWPASGSNGPTPRAPRSAPGSITRQFPDFAVSINGGYDLITDAYSFGLGVSLGGNNANLGSALNSAFAQNSSLGGR